MEQDGKASGLVVFRKNNGKIEYLLLEKSKGKHHWYPPKGKPDDGESEMQTALRETLEESGYSKDDLKIFEDVKQESSHLTKNQSKTTSYWLAELTNTSKDVKLSKEHRDYQWLPLQEACNLAADLPHLKGVLEYFDKYITDKRL